MNKTAQILLNVIVGIFAFVFFLLMVFPLDTAIGHYLQNIEAQNKGKVKIQVGQIDPSLIFDTVFKDFRVVVDGEEVFFTPELTVDFALLPMIYGKYKFSFEADFIKGKINGRLETNNTFSDVTTDLEFDQIILSQFKVFNRYFRVQDQKIPVRGALNGRVFLQLENMVPVDGEIDLSLSRFRVGPAAIQPIELPSINLSSRTSKAQIQISIDGDNNQIDIKKISIPGPDLVLESTGTIRTGRRGVINRMQLDGHLSFSKAILEKVPLLEMVEQQKNDEGVSTFSIVTTPRSQKIKLGEQEFPGINLNQLFQ